MKYAILSIALLSLTSCSWEDISGGAAAELPRAATFGQCVVSCYEKVYGEDVAPAEIPLALEQ